MGDVTVRLSTLPTLRASLVSPVPYSPVSTLLRYRFTPPGGEVLDEYLKVVSASTAQPVVELPWRGEGSYEFLWYDFTGVPRRVLREDYIVARQSINLTRQPVTEIRVELQGKD